MSSRESTFVATTEWLFYNNPLLRQGPLEKGLIEDPHHVFMRVYSPQFGGIIIYIHGVEWWTCSLWYRSDIIYIYGIEW